MKTINIAFVSDNNYFNYMLIAIESIIKNRLKLNNLRFYILNAGINNENIELLKCKYKIKSGIEFIFINIDKNTISKFNVKTHVSNAAFAKIYMCDLIREDRIIYLDCDLIVNDDLEKLWNEFEENVTLKAVWNPFYNYDNKYLGIKDNQRTFNSGVMLLRLDRMRKNNSSNKLDQFLREYNDKTKLHDQAAFNAIFKGDWKELDLKWNVQVSMLSNFYKDLKITKNQYLELYNDAGIIHFTSNSKPWQYRNSHPYKRLYIDTYEESIGTIKYNDINFISLMKKIKEYLRYKYYYYISKLL
ncbi:glycosyltransferase family 8 protein [Clostridium isatidis]|uniref:glycosyltransferase family 8 protein n=1 Tax=Clostridium isatidis TaxID=182773 RepID=UPI003AAAC6DB